MGLMRWLNGTDEVERLSQRTLAAENALQSARDELALAQAEVGVERAIAEGLRGRIRAMELQQDDAVLEALARIVTSHPGLRCLAEDGPTVLWSSMEYTKLWNAKVKPYDLFAQLGIVYLEDHKGEHPDTGRKQTRTKITLDPAFQAAADWDDERIHGLVAAASAEAARQRQMASFFRAESSEALTAAIESGDAERIHPALVSCQEYGAERETLVDWIEAMRSHPTCTSQVEDGCLTALDMIAGIGPAQYRLAWPEGESDA